jgi:plasmid stability protein
MKNITVAVDDEVYRAARIAAAERSTSVSALVRDYLRTLSMPEDSQAQAANALFDAMDKVKGLRAADRLSRDAAHER